MVELRFVGAGKVEKAGTQELMLYRCTIHVYICTVCKNANTTRNSRMCTTYNSYHLIDNFIFFYPTH